MIDTSPINPTRKHFLGYLRQGKSFSLEAHMVYQYNLVGLGVRLLLWNSLRTQ
jgi:hypothetical protein